MEEDDLVHFKAKKKPQFIAAGVATLGALGLGSVLGYTSTAIPDLKLSPEFSHLPNESYSWIGSIAPIGACASGPVAGYLVESLGRKRTMMLMAPVFLLGWLLIGFAKNIEMILAGRFITGLGGGTFSLVVPVYVSETAETSIRGTLGSSLQLMINVGVLFAYTFGYFCPWNYLAFVSASVPVVFFVLMFYMPESPRYLLAKHGRVRASKSLMWLRGAQGFDYINTELNQIQRSIQETHTPSLSEMFQGAILKPIGISLALMFFQQWSGINAVVFYTVAIFQDSGSDLDPNIATIIVGVIQIIASIVSSILMDKAGRRILLMISGVMMTVSLDALGFFFYLKEQDPSAAEAIGWLPLLCLVTFIVAFSLGFGPIAWLLAGEILPPDVRGFAAALATSFNWLNTFFVTKVFDNIQMAVGIQWGFWVFGMAAGLGTIFVHFFVPETKGKTLDEIRRHFSGR